MPFVLSVHTLAIIIWLGGLFLLGVVFRPGSERMDPATAFPLWDRVLRRFFVWAWISLAAILVTGILMVFLKFGGFSGVPNLHRANTALGIPAMVLYAYLYFVPWRRFRQAMSIYDLSAAGKTLARFRTVTAVILCFGVIASVVSIAGRFM